MTIKRETVMLRGNWSSRANRPLDLLFSTAAHALFLLFLNCQGQAPLICERALLKTEHPTSVLSGQRSLICPSIMDLATLIMHRPLRRRRMRRRTAMKGGLCCHLSRKAQSTIKGCGQPSDTPTE